jgi:hypothetical protein
MWLLILATGTKSFRSIHNISQTILLVIRSTRRYRTYKTQIFLRIRQHVGIILVKTFTAIRRNTVLIRIIFPDSFPSVPDPHPDPTLMSSTKLTGNGKRNKMCLRFGSWWTY